MKTIRIFALPSHQTKERTSGVDFARVIQPMKALNGYSDGEVKFEVTIYDIHAKKQVDWLNISQQFDIIYLNYIYDPWGYAAMGAMARKNGVKLVLDLDDSLWNIKTDNPARSAYHKGSQALHDFNAICGDVDYMTTTSNYLKHVIMNNTTKTADLIKVFPNYIDLERYSHRSPFKDDGQIQLLHFGSTTHFQDLLEVGFVQGVDRIFKEYPNVSIRMIGANIPKLKDKWGSRYEVKFGDSDIYKWIDTKFPDFMDEADIMVVPLTDDIYNRCKSAIKFLEASSAKIPGCWANIRQYSEVVRNYGNGFLCKDEKDWYKYLKYLIDRPKDRKDMGEQAFEDVKNEWTIQEHVKDYATFFKQVLDKNSS